MTRARRFSLIVLCVTAIATTFVVAAPPALADVNGCTIDMQNIHITKNTSPDSVDQKSVYKCGDNKGGHVYQQVWLRFCGSQKPPKNEIYFDNNCALKGYNGQTIFPVQNGTSYTKTTPAAGSGLALGGPGWWLAESNWWSDNANDRRSNLHVAWTDPTWCDTNASPAYCNAPSP